LVVGKQKIMKPKLIIAYLLFLSFYFTACYPPRNLNKSISYFERHWTTKELRDFKIGSQNSYGRLEIGVWIRNNWIRSHPKGLLVHYFHKLGIFNPEDMSSIILTSLRRKLNNNNIDLDGQVEHIKAYWTKISECEKNVKSTALSNYDRFKVGDKITIYMYVDTSYDGPRNAVKIECPNNDWNFDANKDLIFLAEIQNKYFINDPSNVFFAVKIDSMNFSNTKILMDTVGVGSSIKLSLRGLTIK